MNFTTNYCNVLKMKEALYILEFWSSQERSTMYSRILEALRKEALCILASGMGQGGGGEGEFPNSRRRRPKKIINDNERFVGSKTVRNWAFCFSEEGVLGSSKIEAPSPFASTWRFTSSLRSADLKGEL